MLVSRSLLVLAAALSAACATVPPAPAAPPTPADPLGATRYRYPAFGAEIATAWPGAGGFDDVVAAVGNDGHGWALVVYRRGVPTGEASLRPEGIGQRPTGLATLDVTQDGRLDLLLFMPPATEPEVHQPQSVLVYSAWSELSGEHQFATGAAATLDGCHDLKCVGERLSRPMTTAEMMSLGTRGSVATRLFYTTPERFRDAVAAAGLRLCEVRHDERSERNESCQTIPAAQVARVYVEKIKPFATELLARVTMGCKPSPGPCGTSDASGKELEVYFTGEGTSRRVSGITFVQNMPRTSEGMESAD
jgi:hypothetical protein